MGMNCQCQDSASSGLVTLPVGCGTDASALASQFRIIATIMNLALSTNCDNQFNFQFLFISNYCFKNVSKMIILTYFVGKKVI